MCLLYRKTFHFFSAKKDRYNYWIRKGIIIALGGKIRDFTTQIAENVVQYVMD